MVGTTKRNERAAESGLDEAAAPKAGKRVKFSSPGNGQEGGFQGGSSSVGHSKALTSAAVLERAKVQLDARIRDMVDEVTLVGREEHDGSLKDEISRAVRELKSDLDDVLPVGKQFVVKPSKASAKSDKAPEYAANGIQCLRGQAIAVAGSFVTGLWVDLGGELGVDVVLEMDPKMFLRKDYSNYRYYDKRWAFLKGLRKALEKKERYSDFELPGFKRSGKIDRGHLIGCNPLRPVLTFRLGTSSSKNVIFRVLPAIQREVFDCKRFVPTKINVAQGDPAGRFYNASVAGDMVLLDDLKYVHQAASKFPLFRQTNGLLRVWAQRQGILRDEHLRLEDDGVNGFALTAFLAKLSCEGRITARSTSVQAFQEVMNYIQNGSLQSKRFEECSAFFAINPLVNILELVSEGRLNLLQECSRRTLRKLDAAHGALDQNEGIFRSIFLPRHPQPLCASFDFIFTVEYPSNCGNGRTFRMRAVEICDRALKGRAKEVVTFSVSENSFALALMLDAKEIWRKIDICDTPQESEEFCNFWGARAKIRQFKSGEISHSVLWEGTKFGNVIEEILEYAFKTHLPDLQPQGLNFWLAPEERLLQNTKALRDNGGKSAHSSREKFGAVLREATRSLPLSVDSILLLSPALRYTAVGSTERDTRVRDPTTVYCALEKSSDWPEGTEPRNAAMIGFLLALKASLSGKGIEAVATRSNLDVVYEELAYRIVLCVGELPSDVEADTHEMIRRICLQDTGSTKSFAMAARLAKRWVSSQMMSGHLDDLLVELVVSKAFVQGRPPATPFAGFVAFLRTVTEFPWATSPFCLALIERDEQMAKFVSDATRQFEQSRDLVHPVAFYVPRQADQTTARRVSGRTPEKATLKRLVVVAKAGLAHLDKSLIAGVSSASAFRQLFLIQDETFDVVFDLDPGVVSHRECAVDSTSACVMNESLAWSKKSEPRLSKQLVGVDPVSSFVESLRSELHDAALIFYDHLGGRKVGLIWRPTWDHPRPLALRSVHLSQPANTRTETTSIRKDKNAAIWRACQLGHQLVSRVSIRGSSM